MSKKSRYRHYFIREVLEDKIFQDRLHIPRKEPVKFAGKPIMGRTETNEVLYDLITGGKPFAYVRPGSGEFNWAAMWEEEQLFGKQLYKRKAHPTLTMKEMMGEKYDEYQRVFREELRDVDVFSCFPDAILEEYLAETYAPKARITNQRHLSPFWGERTDKFWTNALAGKKVAIVTPFAKFLKEQYGKRKELFSGDWMWPDMEIIPIESVWFFGACEEFPTWFDALNCLYERIMKEDFDVVLLSCGPFSINLATMVKRAGRQAIQCGGELQIMFGIRGARWDEDPRLTKYYNDSWIRVSREQTNISDNNSKTMDGGVSYW